jgi:SagB-type dehydrogenase family enzyme
MLKKPEPSLPISQPADGDGSRVHALRQILAYHERSKHTLERYAAGPETLDWGAQPDPFREFEGSPRIALPLVADALTATFDELHNTIPPRQFTLDNIAALLELSFGLSAWKQYGPDLWAVRCNPSSGNLHPTEAYVVCKNIAGIENGIYHYISRDHALEKRCALEVSDASPRMLVGLTSIIWREAWKYGERAFRYCQLDTGHAIGALRYAAATLGWEVQIRDDCSHEELGHWLGLDRDDDFKGAEREEAELLLEITARAALPFASVSLEWHGKANILDKRHMYEWPAIEEATKASRKPSLLSETGKPSQAPVHQTSFRQVKAATLIRQRRSAQRFDAKFIQDADSLYRMLEALMPSSAMPWDIWQQAARIHPVLFVHRVSGLAPGLYALPRSHDARIQMQAVMRRDFSWAKPAGCPEYLPLFLLAETDLCKASKSMNCHQAIASDGTFMLAMLAEFDAPLKEAPWNYRQLFWEAGLLGQVLYLEAEAANLRGTGIGCYFDDVLHELLGLQDKTFQSLYHFTVGSPLTDERIASLPPYPERKTT